MIVSIFLLFKVVIDSLSVSTECKTPALCFILDSGILRLVADVFILLSAYDNLINKGQKGHQLM
jgi:hypothetical protein